MRLFQLADLPQGGHIVATPDALDQVATSVGATRNQVVLAWLLGGSPAVTPIVGVSSVTQLHEIMAARDLVLDAEALAVLNFQS